MSPSSLIYRHDYHPLCSYIRVDRKNTDTAITLLLTQKTQRATNASVLVEVVGNAFICMPFQLVCDISGQILQLESTI